MGKKKAGTAKAKTWIALFRAINVGGKNKLPMAELRKALTDMGLTNVRSYIQSGNVVFSSAQSRAALKREIASLVERSFGFQPALMLFEAEQFEDVAGTNPYEVPAEEGNKVHCFLWEKPPKHPDIEQIELLRADSEALEIKSGGCFVYAPDGVARSKLFAKLEKLLGVEVTARNLKSMTKICEIASEVE